MQYVRNISDSVSTAWNSINPATLSGAIDVIVVEQEDGTLACSPFHVRFGKFSLLRPYEKKVEFKVNGVKQPYSMKLGEGGEAFFVFETTDNIPQSLQTSPLVSPVSSPPLDAQHTGPPGLSDLESLDLNDSATKARSSSFNRPPPSALYSVPGRDGESSCCFSSPAQHTDNRLGMLTPRSVSPDLSKGLGSVDWSPQRPHSDGILRTSSLVPPSDKDGQTVHDGSADGDNADLSERSHSPPPVAPAEALQRAINLSKELSAINIPNRITETGDLMLDMTGFKNNEEDAFRAEILARKVLAEELDGNYDIGALFGVDDQGNLWIYSSEEAKDAASKRALGSSLGTAPAMSIDAASDPGYQSDGSDMTASPAITSHRRTESDVGQMALQTPPRSPGTPAAGDPNRNYAKTLRLTSDQLKALELKPGENSMSFTVNRATCTAFMYLWKHETPVVISDIDGTITKSDALGHVLNMIGRDWTHAGVAKLYSDIAANGYNIMYLTSRSVGQSDTTRAYLAGIVQDGYRLPRGPTILSPDRTFTALRREVYLRKPHVFKMSTLRDIRNLYGTDRTPFYAGFGNRFTDQISYRTVDVPRTRIFTINSNAEVSLDLLSLNKLKLSYVNMTEVVDHYFPPVSTLVQGGGEEYTDFTYWRDTPLDLDDFSASDSDEDEDDNGDNESEYADEDDEEGDEGLGDSYISRDSADDYGEGSYMSESYNEDRMISSIVLNEQDADDEDEEEEYEDGEDEGEDREEIIKDLEERLAVPSASNGNGDAAAAQKKNSPKVRVEDVDAEMITGIKDLTMEKELK
ncbi:nuclear elongation and deformation protein 1 [Rhypophila decipiens]|uniref:Nuclear elongation and deformation protein 1 n=1 Tax=Rhypophila decipiens TaxID=261697 RepID=A0AAN6YH53_9PEZI|nr:nuclear elongation and deformation protein 1 [Rhypophila decipiens]